MSDNKLTEDQWKPLNMNSFEKIEIFPQDGDTISKHQNTGFRPLYESDTESSKNEEFHFIYGGEKEINRASDVNQKESHGGKGGNKNNEELKREELEKEAFDQGMARGEKQGFDEGLKRSLEGAEHMKGIINELDVLWHTMVKKYEDRIIELITRAVEKVVLGRVELGDEIVRRTVLEAFEMIPEPEEVKISINPDDYEYIEAVKEDFFNEIDGLKQVELIPDPSINQGGCRVETSGGTVETDIEKRLDAVKQAILKAGGAPKGGKTHA